VKQPKLVKTKKKKKSGQQKKDTLKQRQKKEKNVTALHQRQLSMKQ